MKKMMTILLALCLCLAMMCPALAAEDDFTPSVSYKPVPGLAGNKDEMGNTVVGYGDDGMAKVCLDDGRIFVIGEGIHAEGTLDDEHACLVITAVADADSAEEIPENAKELLLWVYAQIKEQGMKVFADCEGLQEAVAAALGQNATVEDLVVKDLFDVSVLCDPLEEYLKPEGTTICLDFDLNVAPGTFVTVLAYKNDKWNMIEDVEVLEDGSVTCTTYENFCPIAILVSETQLSESAAVEEVDTSDNSQLVLWSVVAGVSLVAIAGCILILRKNGKMA